MSQMQIGSLKFLLLVSFVLVGCSYSIDKEPTPSIPSPDQYQPNQLTFSSIYNQVLRPSCISCHGSGGGISLETYESVKPHTLKIQNAVFNARSMPKTPSTSLTSNQLGLLNAWLLAGAPEKPPLGSPEEPTPIPLEPIFTSIKYNILEPKCLQCHSPGKAAEKIPLASREEILENPENIARDIVLIGNPEESGLYIAITNEDQWKIMPPKFQNGNPTGFAKLSELEIQTIYEWIQKGAP